MFSSLFGRKKEPQVPFAYSRDSGPFDIMLNNPPLLGNEALVEEVFDALEGTPRQRYSVACKLHEEIQTVFAGDQMGGPVYSITAGEEPNPLVTMVLLPNFKAAARAITFYSIKRGDSGLRFMELWYTRDPRYSRIDPDQFIQRYKILTAGDPNETKLRAAIIEILRERRAPEDGLFSYIDDAEL